MMQHLVHHFDPSSQSTASKTILNTPFKGVYYLPYQPHRDDRGYYTELYRLPELDQLLDQPFQVRQQNLSYSQEHVARGIHAENWQKLLTVLTGSVFCAFVDFRVKADTFGQIFTATCGPDDLTGSFFLPAGIGNSFCVTSGVAHYLYAVDQLYADRNITDDIAVNLFDPDLAIPWPIAQEKLIFSDRDKTAIPFATKFKDVLS